MFVSCVYVNTEAAACVVHDWRSEILSKECKKKALRTSSTQPIGSNFRTKRGGSGMSDLGFIGDREEKEEVPLRGVTERIFAVAVESWRGLLRDCGVVALVGSDE